MATARVIAGLTPRMTRRLLLLAQVLGQYGVSVSVYSGRRSLSEQRERFRGGHTSLDGIAKRSKHQDGAAADLIVSPPYYEAAGYVWEQLGGKWGGNFSDPALAAVEFQHFEE